MNAITASIDITAKTMGGSFTVMGEIMDDDLQFTIEGGGMNLSEEQAEDMARSILRCIKKTRSLYFKIHGRKSP